MVNLLILGALIWLVSNSPFWTYPFPLASFRAVLRTDAPSLTPGHIHKQSTKITELKPMLSFLLLPPSLFPLVLIFL